jgi:hypothetical protein
VERKTKGIRRVPNLGSWLRSKKSRASASRNDPCHLLTLRPGREVVTAPALRGSRSQSRTSLPKVVNKSPRRRPRCPALVEGKGCTLPEAGIVAFEGGGLAARNRDIYSASEQFRPGLCPIHTDLVIEIPLIDLAVADLYRSFGVISCRPRTPIPS